MNNIEIKTNIPTMCGIKETAKNFGIAEYHARQLALSGKVKAVRAGRGKILINQESVAEYFNSSYLTEDKPTLTDCGIKPIPIKL
ncbi:MAG: hypothetical protein K2G83_08445 [Ruminococcus sp.]|nr:hypothetical protein [Ruminococcus sp.]